MTTAAISPVSADVNERSMLTGAALGTNSTAGRELCSAAGAATKQHDYNVQQQSQYNNNNKQTTDQR
jgi:hypothetical protein